ncbi:Proteasome subunit beta type-2 [Taenia crassiceps]|uniref:Proteasome subunit beta n=1 Tax=Taenia crassiceps TaxID=6207 RepID=A0ABR4QDG6_9CEST
MEWLIGIAFNDFAIIAADARVNHSIVTLKGDADKMFKLSKHCLMGVCGEHGDTVQFAEFIQQNMQLYEIRNGYELTPYAAASFTRRNLAEALRTRNPYNVNLLIAGYDPDAGPKIYYMDYLASMVDVPYAVHGHGSFVTLAILDSQYDPAMKIDHALILLKNCINELQKRFVINYGRFIVRVVNKEGIENLPDLV